MKSLIDELGAFCFQAMGEAFGSVLSLQELHPDVALCLEKEFGHYQCNSALRLSKLLKQPPRSIAEKIIEYFPSKEIFAKIEIAGPGFINFSFSPRYLSSKLGKIYEDRDWTFFRPEKKERIIVEFSSPNVAKELHVGHLRSTIIGDSLARLFEFLGHEVIRLNHVGDWGTQFGMLIAYMKQEGVTELEEGKIDLSLLMQWYRAAKTRFDADGEFKKRSQLEVVRLQAQDKNSLDAWRALCSISRKGFEEIYDLLGVEIIERGESFYNPILSQIVADLEAKGLVAVSDGAKCLFLEAFQNREGSPMPLMVQKSDGGYSYDTTDLAAIHQRIFEEKADRIIYVTDSGQSLHFQLIFAAAEKAGWIENGFPRIDHVGFGLVLGPDGKKFKTRSGTTEKLIDLLQEAVQKAGQLARERLPEASEEEIDELSHVLGIGALKYADLSSHRMKDYLFSYERMLRFEGNTAIFLLYAYVRVLGIQKKSALDLRKVMEEGKMALIHPSEISLGLHLCRFQETLQSMAEDLLPHRLTEYLYGLAELFNAFFRDCKVHGSPEEKERLLLCEVTGRVLKQGLALLGLQTVPRM